MSSITGLLNVDGTTPATVIDLAVGVDNIFKVGTGNIGFVITNFTAGNDFNGNYQHTFSGGTARTFSNPTASFPYSIKIETTRRTPNSNSSATTIDTETWTLVSSGLGTD